MTGTGKVGVESPRGEGSTSVERKYRATHSNEIVDVLLVDDREDGLIAMEAVLADPHLRLIMAHSGSEALALLPKYDFAVILLDVQMPGIDGFETAEIIKEQERFRDIPIIFVTAINKDDAYVYKGYDFGAVDYVFKPFDARILRSIVNVFVELCRKSRQIERQMEFARESERRERDLRLAELEVESLKRYRNLADSIPHVVWCSKPDGTMDYFNNVWVRYTGLSQEQSLGLGWQSAFHQQDLRTVLMKWMEAMAGGDGFEAECRIKNTKGEWRWHWFRAVVERRRSGEILAWLGTCTDIHERKCVEENLILAQQDADAANRAKTQFLTNMSHEIRTPLNSILGFAELMMHPHQSRIEQFSCLSTIKRNGHQLLKIIDEILDISKVEAGRIEIETIDVDLQDFFTEIRSFLRVQANEKSLELLITCETEIPKRIKTDPTRLRQIVTNLVGNALKFTTQGRVTLALSWRAEEGQQPGVLRFTVTDTGVGIGPEHVPGLFQPFVQGDSSTTRKFGGTGLGLVLSRRLAHILGGDVRLERTEKDIGSTFVAEIKALPSSSEIFSNLGEPIMLAVQRDFEKGLITPNFLQDVEVLVVDDASDNRMLIQKILSAVGAHVDWACDGFEGIRKVIAKKYDVILMDIQMPQMDGYQTTAELRNQGYTGPIIALTAHALKEERENSLRSGCDDHLTKPIDRQNLIRQIAKFSDRFHRSFSDGSSAVKRMDQHDNIQ